MATAGKPAASTPPPGDHLLDLVFSSAQQHSCSVCFERLDQDPAGVLTTICNHSFHYSCISKWTDSTCPVCRYCQQPEKFMCAICGTSEDLWVCLLCGHAGCGRHKGCHAFQHWGETQHCYSLELETTKVWDYAENNYVHLLIQSKEDTKLVEYNSHAGMDEALLNNKCEAYNESLLLEVKEEIEREILSATEKRVGTRFKKLQDKIDEVVEDNKFLDGINDNLIKDQDKWIQKQEEIKAREEASLKSKDEKIKMLERERADLLARLLGQDGAALAQGSISGDDIQGGTSTSIAAAPESSSSKSSVCGKKNRKRK